MHPANFGNWLSKQKSTKVISGAILEAIHHIKEVFESSQSMSDQLKEIGFKKKQFKKKTIYTVNVDAGEGKHRLIFELLSGLENSFLILRKVALHHDYDKALNWKSLQRSVEPITESHLTSLGFTTLVNTHIEIDAQAFSECESIINYGEEYLSLSTIQTDILARNHFPQLIVGPPGSGKTLLIHAFFQEQVLQHCSSTTDPANKLKLLYLTQNERLVKSHQNTWSNWVNKTFDIKKPPFEVSFETFHTFNTKAHEKYFPREEDSRLVDSNDYLKSITNIMRRDGQHNAASHIKITAKRILEEIIHSAYVLNSDIGKRYEDSDYQTLGVKKTSVPEEDKPYIFSLYQRLQNKISDIVSLPEFAENDKYDLVCIDEAQKSSLQNLLTAMQASKNNQTIFCGDSHQRGPIRVPSLQLLAEHLHQKNIQLQHETLPITHRLKERVSLLCSNLILLETNLRGGQIDSTSYAPFVSSHPAHNDDSACWVETFNDSYRDLKSKAYFEILVLAHQDIEAAKILMGSTSNPLLAEDAQGLEYKEVFLYVSQETQKAFKNISNEMEEKGIDEFSVLTEKANASPDKRATQKKEYAIMSMLFIALSRSLGKVHIYFEGAQKIIAKTDSNASLKRFLTWMKAQCHTQILCERESSKPEEWLKFINAYLCQNHESTLQSARNHLETNFRLSESLSEAYVTFYQSASIKPTIAQCQEWITHSKTRERRLTPLECATGGEEETKLTMPLEAKSSAKAPKKNKKLDNKALCTVNIKTKKAKEEELKKIWNSLSTPSNIKVLLRKSNLKDILFLDKMANGEALFDSIISNSRKFNEFMNGVILIKNEAKKEGKKKKGKNAKSAPLDYSLLITAVKQRLDCHKADFANSTSLLERYYLLEAEHADRFTSLLFFLWEEINNDLTPNDLTILGTQVHFIGAAFLLTDSDILSFEETKRLLNTKDLASFLCQPANNKEYGSIVLEHFFKNNKGLNAINAWFSEIKEFIEFISLAKRFIRFYSSKKTMTQEQKYFINKILDEAIASIVKALEVETNTQKRYFLLNSLLELQVVDDTNILLAETPKYLEMILNCLSKCDHSANTPELTILSKIIKTHSSGHSLFKLTVLSLLPLISSNVDPLLKGEYLSIISAFFRTHRALSLIDDIGLISLLTPLLKEVPLDYDLPNKQRMMLDNLAILEILNSLSKLPENFTLFIENQLPEKLLILMLNNPSSSSSLASHIMLRLIQTDAQLLSLNVSEENIIRASEKLIEPNDIFHRPVLMLINSHIAQIRPIPLQHSETLQAAVFSSFSISGDIAIQQLALSVIETMIDADIAPIPLSVEHLLTLAHQYKKASDDEKPRLFKIITFVSKIPDNAETYRHPFSDAPQSLTAHQQTVSPLLRQSIFSARAPAGWQNKSAETSVRPINQDESSEKTQVPNMRK